MKRLQAQAEGARKEHPEGYDPDRGEGPRHNPPDRTVNPGQDHAGVDRHAYGDPEENEIDLTSSHPRENPGLKGHDNRHEERTQPDHPLAGSPDAGKPTRLKCDVIQELCVFSSGRSKFHFAGRSFAVKIEMRIKALRFARICRMGKPIPEPNHLYHK